MPSPATRRAWRWLELALVTTSLAAIVFALVPFTIDRRVTVQPPTFPIGHQSAPIPPYTEVWHVRCDTGDMGDRFVGSGGTTMFFNEASPTPVERASSLCEPARAEHRQGMAALSIITLAAGLLVRFARRRRAAAERADKVNRCSSPVA